MAITYIGFLPDPLDSSVDDVPEDQAPGGNGVGCERERWIDRVELRRKWGNAVLSACSRLRCLGCGNRTSNK